MVLIIGVWIIVKRNKKFLFSWRKLFAIGLISAFNKGISGGGYGPLVTGGQIINGRESKSSIGNTTLVESNVISGCLYSKKDKYKRSKTPYRYCNNCFRNYYFS
jgi:hypothetical protein